MEQGSSSKTSVPFLRKGYPNFVIQFVQSCPGVLRVEISRPRKANAMNAQFWDDFRSIFEDITDAIENCKPSLPQVRVVILTGAGKTFTAGLDVSDFFPKVIGQLEKESCEGRRREKFRKLISGLQSTFSAIECCPVPVIACIQGACIGGGVDLISACDIRYCTADAYFVVKEVDLAITADLGTLQRLPHIIGGGVVRELALTGRTVSGSEALRLGLVSACFETYEDMMRHVLTNVAVPISKKSPLAVRGTKRTLLFSRDRRVADGLDFVALYNSAVLLSDDLMEVAAAQMERRHPVYARL